MVDRQNRVVPIRFFRFSHLIRAKHHRLTSVHLRSRSEKDFRSCPPCQTQHVDRAKRVGLDGLDRVVHVVGGRSRRGEVVDFIDWKQKSGGRQASIQGTEVTEIQEDEMIQADYNV